ncbi:MULTISPECIES: DNA-binding protein [Fusobacterium]|uniref:DNA-binding protein n=1 Tax=Fusobacterium TaxID=848 RepID=UPI000C70F697|nr:MULTISPECIES: DNA-binding protein [Fusobacterium]
MERKVSDELDAKNYQMEIEEYLLTKLEKCSEFEKRVQNELVEKYGLWTTIEKAAKIIKRSKSTMYKYKEDNLIIYRQNSRIISVYTKSLIFVL